MSNIQRMGITRRWSDVVIYGGVAYFVEVPDDPTLPPREQFLQVFAQIEARLKEFGSDPTRLLQTIVYLPDPSDLPVFNELWDNWIPQGHAPSRACLHAALAAPGYRVELVITAAV
jgi:enamine deaminase RidA (YjgF/YER057c/UK114 family)